MFTLWSPDETYYKHIIKKSLLLSTVAQYFWYKMEVSHSFDTLNTTGRRSQCSAHHAGHCELDLPPPPSSVIGGLRAPPELCTADSVLQCPAVCTADKPPLAPSHRQLSSCQSLSVRSGPCPSVSARSYSDTLRRRHNTLDRSVRSIRSHADR